MRAVKLNQVDRICSQTNKEYPRIFNDTLRKLNDHWGQYWQLCCSMFPDQPQYNVIEHTVAMCLSTTRSNTSLGDVICEKFDFEVKSFNSFRSIKQIIGSVPITNSENRFYIVVSGNNKSNPKFYFFSSRIAFNDFVPKKPSKRKVKNEIIKLELENEILRRLEGCVEPKKKGQRMSFNITDPSGRKINIRFDLKFSCS